MPDSTELAELRRRMLDPFRSNLEPAIMADAFLTVASARGMVTRPENLGGAHHRIGPAQTHIEARMAENVLDLPDALSAACSRTRDAVRRLLPTGGDAA